MNIKFSSNKEMISPLTNEKKYGDVSTEYFTTLGVTVVQNSSDIATATTQIAANTTKPNSSQVDSQIDAKNTPKTETNAAVATRTTPANVQTALNTRVQAQDTFNFLVFQDRSTVLTAAVVAATYAPQSTSYTKNEINTQNSTTTL